MALLLTIYSSGIKLIGEREWLSNPHGKSYNATSVAHYLSPCAESKYKGPLFISITWFY